MSLSSGMNAGVAGLSVNSTRLAVISDNIANSNTNGYRKADVDFSALVTASSGGGTFTAGGVSVSTYRNVSQAGALITSGNATDIAVAGTGMLPVTPEGSVDLDAGQRPFQMVATGSFRQDENGYLKTPGGLVLSGWETTADGALAAAVSRDTPTSLVPVKLSAYLTASDPTTALELGVNLPANETEAGSTGLPISQPIEYFDALGLSNTLTINYTPVVPVAGVSSAWTLSISDSTTPVPGLVAEFDLTFDGTRAGAGDLLTAVPSAGNPVDPNGVGTTAIFDAASGVLTINVPDGPIEVRIQSTTEGAGLSQLAAPFTPNGLSKNGSPAGNLANLEISADGILSGVYDNGSRRALYKIPLVSVPNPDGLLAIDNQAFEISRESGNMYLFDAGSGPAGEISGFALQQSTVDIAEELTDMIITQRAFSSNATVIRTVDEMLQETTSLKR